MRWNVCNNTWCGPSKPGSRRVTAATRPKNSRHLTTRWSTLRVEPPPRTGTGGPGLTSCDCGNRSSVPSTTQVAWRLSGCGRGSENTDSQHLLAEQQVAPMYSDSNPESASARGLLSFVLPVIRVTAQFSTLKKTASNHETIRRYSDSFCTRAAAKCPLTRVRRHYYFAELWFYTISGD